MKSKIFLTSLILAAAWAIVTAQQPTTPTVDQLLELKRVGSPATSPDGRFVAYTIRETDWEDDAYETQIWLAEAKTGETRQLTRGDKSASAPAWSPDSRWLAFASDRDDKRQVYRISPTGGEAEVITSAGEGIGSLAWSPDGTSVAYTMTDPKPEPLKERDKKYGEFEVVDHDFRMSHLHVIDLETRKTRRLTEGAFTVGSFSWSPDGRTIAFDHRVSPDPGVGCTGHPRKARPPARRRSPALRIAP